MLSIELDNIPYTKKIKDRIREEFDTVLQLLDFDTKVTTSLEDGM